MGRAEFVHLHNHTEYSLLDGAIRIRDAVSRARDYGLPALAITDHGNLFGAVDFYQQAHAAGVKPIIGCEVYVAPGRRDEKQPGHGAMTGTSHLTLLARDRTGYENLVRLVSLGYLEGFYYKPRIDHELLARYSRGLIALSACIKGEIPKLLLAEKRDRAKELALHYRGLFGPGNYYFEIMNHGLADEATVSRALVSLGKELGIPVVATNDCHYLDRGHARAHDILLCLQTGKDLNDPKRMRFTQDTFYMRSPEEMCALFAELPGATRATLEIADRCELDLKPGKFHLPTFPLPEGYDDPSVYLEVLAREGLRRRYGEPTPEQLARMAFELQTIQRMGFSAYFLIIRDLIHAARERGIPVGPGRGSVVGSLVAYSLGITDVDPLEHGLLFERFLNPERVTMPDIDIDFCYERRNEVIEYMRHRYGQESLCQIITFGTMAARAALRDVGRVLGLPYGEVDRVAKMVPGELGMTLDKALERSPELRALGGESPTHQALLSEARNLEGMSRHASIHAAGVVIAPGKLIDYVPLFQSTKGEITTQYDMGSLEKLGLLKIDLLGLRTLTVVHDTLAMVKEGSGETIELGAIPLDDPAVYRSLAEGHTVGVFQLESSGMRDLLRRLHPDRFEDLVAVNALYRPGPLGSNMVDDFIQGKRGKKIHYLHPALEPILRPTYGVILYQEQVMGIANQLAGFSMGQADLLRGAMAKKKHEVMAEQRAKFVDGAVARKVPAEKAEKIFDLMAHFAGYGFNKSHSAAYALVSFQTAWLKVHHPREFMAATMTSEMGDSDRLLILCEECRRMGIPVLPPDVNASEARFTVVDAGIPFGLAAVKNVGMASVEAALRARREGGAFASLFDFCARVDSHALNRRVVESLVAAGAFDSLAPAGLPVGAHRAALFASVPVALEHGQSMQRDRERGQASLFDDVADGGAGFGMAEPRLAAAGSWSRRDTLAKERDALGFYLSGHPMEGYEAALRKFGPVPLAELKERGEEESLTVAGLLVTARRILNKKGQEMAFVTIEDRTGTTEAIVFADVFSRCASVLEGGAPLVIIGRVSAREDEEPKLIAREIRRLDDEVLDGEEEAPAAPDEGNGGAKNGRGGLHVSLERDAAGSVLPQLVALLRRHRGDLPLFLHLVNGSEVVDVESGNLGVSPSPELLKELAGLLGAGRARLEHAGG